MADTEINIVTAPLSVSNDQKSSSVDLSPSPQLSVDEVSDNVTTSVDTIKMTTEIDIKSKPIVAPARDNKRTVGVVTKPLTVGPKRDSYTATASGSDKKTAINITGYGALSSKAYLSNVHGRTASDEFFTSDIIVFDLGSTLLDEASTITYIEFDLISVLQDEAVPTDLGFKINLVTHRFDIGYALDSGFQMNLATNLSTIAPLIDETSFDWSHELPVDVGVLLADISHDLHTILPGDTATLSDICETVFVLMWTAFDTVTLIDEANAAVDKGIVDNVIVSEAFVKSFDRIYGADSATLSEFFINAVDKGIIDDVTAVGVLISAVEYLRDLDDQAGLTELLATLVDKGFFDFVTAYENFATSAQFPREYSESMSLSDTYGRNFDWTLATDTYTISDLIIAGLTFVRDANDSASLSEAMTLLMDAVILEQALTSDSTSIVADILREFLETSTLSDILAFTQALQLYETLVANETFISEVTYLRDLVDEVSPTDTYFRLVGKDISETLTLTATYLAEIITQDYALEDYFAEDYATVG